MAEHAGAVLSLIRTRADLSRWNAANEHGRQMHDAVDLLEEAAYTVSPSEMLAVTTKAIASGLAVIMRADDSSGVIGDACRRLLDLHPKLAVDARPASRTLVDWMIRLQFDSRCDYFSLDPVAYAPALGAEGIELYRSRLAEIAAELGPRPPEDQRWDSPRSTAWFTLDYDAQRLAVLDRDVEAVIATHARDRRVAAWLHDTAKALAEIDQVGLAIDWAQQAATSPAAAIRPPLPPSTGASCSPSTARTSCCRLAWRCSSAGRRLRPRPDCTRSPARAGRSCSSRS